MEGRASVSATSVSASIMGCDCVAQVGESVLRPVRRLLGARSAVYLQLRHDPCGGVFIDTGVYDGERPESLSDYISGQFHEDPLVRPMLRGADRWGEDDAPVLWHLRRTVPSSALRTSNYFRRFLDPHDVGDIIALAFPMYVNGPQLLAVGIHRAMNASGFEEVHELALDGIAQPLRLALRNACLSSELDRTRDAASSLSRRMDCDYVTFDSRLNVDGGSGALLARLARDRRFADGVRAALDGLIGSRDGAGLTPDTWLPVALPDATPGQLVRFDVHDRPRYLLTCGVAPSHPAAGAEGGSDPYAALTGREREVARRVAMGERNRAIAQALSISIRTVENHLRAIYDKLGVHNRTRLVTYLLGHIDDARNGRD